MKKIIIGCYMVGMVQTNVYYLHREGEGDTIVFDPADYGKEINDEHFRQLREDHELGRRVQKTESQNQC